MKRFHKNKEAARRAALLMLLCVVSAGIFGCGGKGETAAALSEEPEKTASLTEAEAAFSEEAAVTEQSDVTEAASETEDLTEETYPGTVAAEGVNEEASPYFGVMHALLLSIQKDEAEGTTLYTLQDRNDPENAWSISSLEIGDITLELQEGMEIALLFNGDIISDSENVEFIAIVPEGDYQVKRTEGRTLSNVMSSFVLKTEQGEELVFLKDNCGMEEGAMQEDSGDEIVVYYVTDEVNHVNYPLKIYKR